MKIISYNKHKEGQVNFAPDAQMVEENQEYECISTIPSKRERDVENSEDIKNKKPRADTPFQNSENGTCTDFDEYRTPCGLRPGIDWDGNAQCGCSICMGEEGY
jgi:hypothetical protein